MLEAELVVNVEVDVLNRVEPEEEVERVLLAGNVTFGIVLLAPAKTRIELLI